MKFQEINQGDIISFFFLLLSLNRRYDNSIKLHFLEITLITDEIECRSPISSINGSSWISYERSRNKHSD